MRIMVRTLRGDRVALDVDGTTTTVAQVKGMVMARERIAVAMQRLFFAGRCLDDDHRALADYGVRHDSVVFLSLRLATDAYDQYVQISRRRRALLRFCFDEPIDRSIYGRKEMHNVRLMQPETATTKQEMHQQQQLHVHVAADDEEEKAIKRKPVSRRALRKILSRLQVDAWTSQHDAKFLDLLLRHTGGGGARNVGELTGEDWSSIRAELNAATGSGFPVEELQRRLGEFRREYEAASRIKNHPRFSYDPRRRVVVAKQADWKNYILENPEAATYEGRSPRHLGRLRAIFSGDGGGGGGAKCRETKAKSCLRKLLRNFRLRFKL
uniref:Ubiquitin-like domain-containing protein n=1 Tax=Oryza meridionalis TaxID=40149 RepID=A0A0E0DZY6_9ORYZ